MKASVTDGFQGMQDYDCKYPWPEGSELTCYEIKPKFDPAILNELLEEGEEPLPTLKWGFQAYFPVPELSLRPYWRTGTGLVTPRLMAEGSGWPLDAAEEAAWTRYQNILVCPHELHRPWLTKEMLSWINHLEKLANGTAER